MDKKHGDMLMEILNGIDGAMDDSVMDDVAQRKPEACITISISGPGAKVKQAPEPEDEILDVEEPEEDELGSRLAAVAKKRK